VTATSSTTSSATSVEVVTDSARLSAVADQWNELWARTPAVGVFQSFDYAVDAWELVARPKGYELACLLGWDDGRLVAVWPFVTYRNRLWTHARQLVASGVELHELLIDETIDRDRWIQQAWTALTTSTRADVVDISFFETSATAPALGALPARAIEKSAGGSVRIGLGQENDWDVYYSSLSKSYRKDFAKGRRRLEALGELEFAVLEAGDDRIDSLVDWTLAQKRTWADYTGKKGEWLYSDRYRDFLTHQLAAPGKGAKNVLLTLTLNGEVIAAQIGAVGNGRFDAVIAGFHADYDKYSPGTRINEAMIRWAWEQGVDCDLGAGTEPYKTFWSRNQVMPIITHSSAISWWGVAALGLRRAAQRVRRVRRPVR
jgi:CelD/BcsL family acetyltransferase involved in cellulose biosynthesis